MFKAPLVNITYFCMEKNIKEKAVRLKLTLFIILISGFLFRSFWLKGQSYRKDTLNIPCLSVTLGFCLPMTDMADRYNFFGQGGGAFIMKFRNNMLLVAEGVVLYGEGYKGPDPLRLILNQNGTITNQYGQPAEFSRGMRGMQLSLKTGYIYNRWAHNPNSGITLTAGVGFLQSRYWIDQRGNNVPQIMGDYVKGYDRLSNGLALNQFLGYTYFHNKNFWHVYAGIEFTEAWTQIRRDWDFTLMRRDNSKFFDTMTTFKVGWIISFVQRESEEIYYY